MHTLSGQLVRIVALAAVACVLGMALLMLDHNRRATASAAEPVALRGPAAQAEQPAARSSAATLVAASAAPAAVASPVAPATSAPTSTPVAVTKRGGVACGEPHVTVDIVQDVRAFAAPGGRIVGTVPAVSHYLGSDMRVWVQAVSADGAWGKITLPWSRPVDQGAWIPLDGVALSSTPMLIVGDVSDRTFRVYRGCVLQMSVPMAVGADGSPSPFGRFWVTDRVAVPKSQPEFGTFAFGLSTIQPHPPAGWTGGNQMAIHGTNAPSSIGTAASAGCLRVSESTLARLRSMIGTGTPVVIQR